ncbi:dienelactone hydrolase family protein [bacterium RCC_150]
MTQLGKFEAYLLEEFFDDYRAGEMSHSAFTRRVAFITGSMAEAASVMVQLGCRTDELPCSSDPMPTPNASPSASLPQAKSPLSVPEGALGLVTETVLFRAGGTDISAYLARPENAGQDLEGSSKVAAVLVCHENRGLTPHIQDVARRFAKAGYVALAPDLLSREGGTANLDPDAVPGALTRAGAGRHVADFSAAFEYLGSLDFVDGERIAMNGYCFGGGITWQAATEITGLKATAAFYGPAPDLDKVHTIKPAVFGVYAENDQRITGAMPALRDALDTTDIPHKLTVYPGVDHAFHNDTSEHFNEGQATAAWHDMLDWFREYV